MAVALSAELDGEREEGFVMTDAANQETVSLSFAYQVARGQESQVCRNLFGNVELVPELALRDQRPSIAAAWAVRVAAEHQRCS
jgi:hypothetical protein